MKLNWAERWVVNNPLRVIEQRIQVKKLARMMPLKPGSRCLEIGCGRGTEAKFLLNAFDPGTLYATDLDFDMLKKALGYVPANVMERITLAAVDGHYLPFRDSSMDVVFGFGVLHHIPDWRGALGEVERVLKKDGCFFFEELYPGLYQNCVTRHILAHPGHGRFHSHDLRKELDDLGLSLYWCRELKRIGILGIAVKRGEREINTA